MSTHSHSHSDSHAHGLGIYYGVYAILMVLLAVTVWMAFKNFGELNLILAMVVATVKAALVVWFFMHVREASRLVLASILAGLVTLSIAFLFIFADYFMR